MVTDNNARRIAIFLSRLAGGGAERAMIYLANRFVDMGHEVDLVLLRHEGPYLDLVDSRINVVELDVSRMLLAPLALRRYQAERQPDVFMSAQFHADQALLLSKKLFGWKTRIVPSVQVALTAVFEQSASKRERMFRYTLKRLYPSADRLVAISAGVGEDVQRVCNISGDKITLIHNPVVTPDFAKRLDEEISHEWFDNPGPPVIIAMGRLTKQKDFPTLLKAFAKLRQRVPSRLLILGEGEDRKELEKLAQDLGLDGDVLMPGFVSNPYPWLKKADVFVLSSLWEGFANVVAEALACGTPVVSTDCPHGPREILRGGEFGRLVAVGDADALAGAIEETLSKPADPDTLQARGHEFRIEPIADEYLEVLFGGENAGRC